MRGILACSVFLSAASSVFAGWVPYSQLRSRARSNLLDCLEDAGLDPVVEGDPGYATDAAPFNLRYVPLDIL